jgi:hypothetical protein
MSVQLAILKSGEQIISDVKQLVDENEKVVSLVFDNPYVVGFLTPELLFESNSSEDEVEHRVMFSPWLPLSLDRRVSINPDAVITVVEPIEWVKKSYEEKMNSLNHGVFSDDAGELENIEVITE